MNKEIRNDIAENETHWLVDGSRLVVANEAEIDGDEDVVLAADKPNDPLGTISIIAIANGTPVDTAQSLDFTAFPNAAALQADAELGRSFSIYNATTGAQVFDSGSDLEQRAYATLPTALLGKSQVLGRLDNKGPEPESVVVGQIGSKTYAFVGLERTSAILMYDLSNPAAPVFVQWLQNTTDMANGDISPEGLAFVPAANSPTGKALLLVGYEVSGTLAVYEIN